MTAVIQTPDSFIASLLPDSDKKMVRIAGRDSSVLLGNDVRGAD